MKKILGIGNPLLDVSAEVDKKLLERFSIKHSYQFEGPEHAGYYEELAKVSNVKYLPGGSTLNSIRVASALHKNEVLGNVFFVGSVGQDTSGDKMHDLCCQENISPFLCRHPTAKSGVCGVSIVEKERFLCTRIGAAREFLPTFISEPQVSFVVQSADIVYSAGFFLDSSAETVLKVAKEVSSKGGIYSTGLSAPFIIEVYMEQLMNVLPYSALLFGNEEEFAKFGGVKNMGTDLQEIVRQTAQLPLADPISIRTVICTQGELPAIVAIFDKKKNTTEILIVPSVKLRPEDIVDTNGAGDAFVGGFLYGLSIDAPLERCTKIAHYAAAHIVQRSGCDFKFDMTKEPLP